MSCLSEFLSNSVKIGWAFYLHNGCPNRWFEHASPKFKSDKDSLNYSNERVNMSTYAPMRTLFVLLDGFYNAKESITVVLTKHFDLLYNDDCFAGGKTIFIVLGDWQVLSTDMLWCLTMQPSIPSTYWWPGVTCSL